MLVPSVCRHLYDLNVVPRTQGPGTDTSFAARRSLDGVLRSTGTVYPEQQQVLGEGGLESWSLTAPPHPPAAPGEEKAASHSPAQTFVNGQTRIPHLKSKSDVSGKVKDPECGAERTWRFRCSELSHSVHHHRAVTLEQLPPAPPEPASRLQPPAPHPRRANLSGFALSALKTQTHRADRSNLAQFAAAPEEKCTPMVKGIQSSSQ